MGKPLSPTLTLSLSISLSFFFSFSLSLSRLLRSCESLPGRKVSGAQIS
jgi:hypothetical protein